MKEPVCTHSKNICELLLPDSENSRLCLRMEFPHFDGEDKGFRRINAFYEKRQKRLSDYYTHKTTQIGKMFADGKDPVFPSSITLSYRITLDTDEIKSIFFTSETVIDGKVYRYYSAESWNVRNGYIIMLSDVVPTVGKYRWELFDRLYDECVALPRSYFPDLRRRLRRYYSPDNFYFTDNGIAVFYQPGTICDASYGLITIRIETESGQ